MEISNVDYHITDICNLKCVSCNHFCPLVPDTAAHKPIEQIKADLLLLSKFKHIIKCVSIMGGEPTLHPDLNEILRFTRSIFPFNDIHLVTNGTRYKDFHKWRETIIKNKILVVGSQYPYRENFKEGYEYLEKLLGENYAHSRWDIDTLNMQAKPFSNKILDNEDRILFCRMRGACSQLRNGKLYLCNYAANLDFLKNYFKDDVKIEQDGKDYVDLNTCTEDDIEELIKVRKPLICRYCKECMRYDDLDMEWVPWRHSERKIEEWVEK